MIQIQFVPMITPDFGWESGNNRQYIKKESIKAVNRCDKCSQPKLHYKVSAYVCDRKPQKLIKLEK